MIHLAYVAGDIVRARGKAVNASGEATGGMGRSGSAA